MSGFDDDHETIWWFSNDVEWVKDEIYLTMGDIHKEWLAHKEYADGSVGVAFMFAPSFESLIFKLEEDGEERSNIVKQ